MRDRLIDHVRGLFRDAADTPRNRELEEEILQNTLDRYDDLVAQGVSEAEAYSQAAANIGNVRDLWEQLPEQDEPPQPKKKFGIAGVAAIVILAVFLAQAVLFGLKLVGRGSLQNVEQTIESQVEEITRPVENWAEDVENLLEGKNFGQSGGFGETAAEPADGMFEVAADGIKELNIDWIAGSVLVEVGAGETVSVAETGGGNKPLVWNEQNGVLSIDFQESGIQLATFGKDLTVRLPASLADGLSSIRISTTSADVQVAGLSVGKLSVSSVSGNLTVEGTCREWYADSTSGRVSFVGDAQDVEADTVSGSVDLRFRQTPDEISVDTTSGRITVAVPENRSFEAEFDTVSGIYTCEHRQPDRDEVRYTGTERGEQAEFEFDTVSGNVEIVKS